MAAYFLRSKHFSRGKGSRVTRAAAYRAGERIRDERTGEIYDHSDRRDIAYKDVVLPSELAGRTDMVWTQDRATLWNAAEHTGRRCNSRLARELLVLVPPELAPPERARLVRGFSQELADRYRCAVDVTLHIPRPGADRRNHHAHLLMTVREVTPDGLGPRTALELGGRERHLRGLGPSKYEYLSIRQRWAERANEALARAGLAARIDHRSLQAQGLDREPTPTIPEKVFYAERRSGAASPAGDAIRARHRERLAARLEGGQALQRVVQRQKQELRQRALQDLGRSKPAPANARWASLTRAERNAIRRQQYRARRDLEKQDPEGEARRREAARQRYRAAFRDNPAVMREQRRRYRQAHAQEINRKQREYRKANSQEVNRKRREHRHARAQGEARRQQPPHGLAGTEPSPGAIGNAAPAPTPQESARAWLADSRIRRAEPAAQHSAEQWQAHDQREATAPTPEDSAREWLAAQAGRTGPDFPGSLPSQSPAAARIEGETDDGATRGKNRRRDYGLEP